MNLVRLVAFIVSIIWIKECVMAYDTSENSAKPISKEKQIGTSEAKISSYEPKGTAMTQKVIKTDAEWKKQLTPEQFRITRKKGTERAFTGEYYNCKEKGLYQCVCCGNELFSSETKFDSGTGWPSFWAPIGEGNIKTKVDSNWGMKRTEILCSKCDAHLGHVFDDGPQPTYRRYCINSLSLKLSKKQ